MSRCRRLPASRPHPCRDGLSRRGARSPRSTPSRVRRRQLQLVIVAKALPRVQAPRLLVSSATLTPSYTVSTVQVLRGHCPRPSRWSRRYWGAGPLRRWEPRWAMTTGGPRPARTPVSSKHLPPLPSAHYRHLCLACWTSLRQGSRLSDWAGRQQQGSCQPAVKKTSMRRRAPPPFLSGQWRTASARAHPLVCRLSTYGSRTLRLWLSVHGRVRPLVTLCLCHPLYWSRPKGFCSPSDAFVHFAASLCEADRHLRVVTENKNLIV